MDSRSQAGTQPRTLCQGLALTGHVQVAAPPAKLLQLHQQLHQLLHAALGHSRKEALLQPRLLPPLLFLGQVCADPRKISQLTTRAPPPLPSPRFPPELLCLQDPAPTPTSPRACRSIPAIRTPGRWDPGHPTQSPHLLQMQPHESKCTFGYTQA